MSFSFIMKALVVILLLVCILFAIIIVELVKVNRRIREKKLAEEEHQRLCSDAICSLYENLFEINVTKNAPANKRTKRLFKRIGALEDSTYESALRGAVRKYVNPRHMEEAINALSLKNIKDRYNIGKKSFEFEILVEAKEFKYRWMRFNVRLFYQERVRSLFMIIFVEDVDDRRKYKKEMENKVQRDPMTELYNKVALESMIKEAILQNRKRAIGGALWIIDLDFFKIANDKFGHVFGDMVLKSFANDLASFFRGDDIVGRIGGDEFAVYICQNVNETQLKERAEGLLKVLSRTYNTENGETYTTTASIGIAYSPYSEENFEKLYVDADTALYDVKKKGKNSYILTYPKEYQKLI